MTPVWWLLAFPPLLLLLYILKLRRRDVRVSSTWLWRRSLEDLRANAPFQRLRRSLLFWLQLAALALLIFAIWRPRWRDDQPAGRQLIVMLDVSASMGAREADGSRLEAARRDAIALVNAMQAGDRMMLLTFASRPVTLQPWTEDRDVLRARLRAVRETALPTDLGAALAVAHGVARAIPRAEVHVLGDGGYRDLEGLAPEVQLLPFRLAVRASNLDNVAIVEADVRRSFGLEPRTELFALVRNLSDRPVRRTVSLHRDETLVDIRELELGARGSRSLLFDATALPAGLYRVQIEGGDALAADDRAWLRVDPPPRWGVGLVGEGNPWIDSAVRSMPGVRVERLGASDLDPEILDERLEADRRWVLVIDRNVPRAVPPLPAIFVGCHPPLPEGVPSPAPVDRPVILDWDRSHPVHRFLVYADVYVESGFIVPPHPGYRSLVDCAEGSLVGVLTRTAPDGRSVPAVIVGFDVLRSNWPLSHFSFPLFFGNAVRWLGTGHRGEAHRWRTGRPLVHRLPVRLREARPVRVEFVAPDGREIPATLERGGEVVLGEARQAGVYELRTDGRVEARFGVSLLDESESRLSVASEVDLGDLSVSAEAPVRPVNRELWPYLALLALGFLLLEWYVYNRRVYV